MTPDPTRPLRNPTNMSHLHEAQTINKRAHILPIPSLTHLTTRGTLNPLKNTTNTSHNKPLHQDPSQPPPEPRFPFVAPLYPALRSLEVAGGGLRKKGIRGAGSVVRYALSFGRHSRQPFGRGLAPLRPLPHPLVATLLGALTAPAPLRSTGLPSTAPPGLFRGAPLRVCFRRLCYGTDCCLCHRSKLRPSEATSALMSVPDCLCCQHHQQKVIASRHEFDTCPLSSTIPPRASVGSPRFSVAFSSLCPRSAACRSAVSCTRRFDTLVIGARIPPGLVVK